ncbi:MAG: archaellin/type IV pilin N-terminal domain-containing protein [Salinirussus sp.]
MAANEGSKRGQVGIGTLIVFIGMVLVAAIAAGVLINTAGFLQTDAEKTGRQSSEQVTDRVQVISETGLVGNSQDTDSGREVETLEFKVKRAPGAGDIDVADATLHYVGPAGAADYSHTSGGASSLSAGASNFATDTISGSGTVLSDDSDVIKITIKGDDDGSAMDAIEPGKRATVEISTADGGSAQVSITVPESLSGESAVSV